MLEMVWKEGNPLTLLVGMQIRIAIMKNSMRFVKKPKTELPYDPKISFLGIHLEKNMIQKDTHTPMFTATAKTRKQPKCPLNKHRYTYTKEYYSAIKKNEITPFAVI